MYMIFKINSIDSVDGFFFENLQNFYQGFIIYWEIFDLILKKR
jgi:hypothetical protein